LWAKSAPCIRACLDCLLPPPGLKIVTRTKTTTITHGCFAFYWRGDTRRAVEIPPSEPARVINLADAAAVMLEERQPAPAAVETPTGPPEPEGYALRRISLLAALRNSDNPAKTLDVWGEMIPMLAIVACLRADAEVQPILAKGKAAPVQASESDAIGF
jgi:hypothetical protein